MDMFPRLQVFHPMSVHPLWSTYSTAAIEVHWYDIPIPSEAMAIVPLSVADNSLPLPCVSLLTIMGSNAQLGQRRSLKIVPYYNAYKLGPHMLITKS